jgi:peptidylprolyl isomerase/peptidyl-prolyl cis-trans isomerase D
MVPAFEKAAFGARIGDVVGPVRTQFGLHIIRVTARDRRELRLAHILMRIVASPQTKNDLSDRARDFAYNAGESDFARAASEAGFEVRETQVQEKGGVVPGVGVNDAIIRWAFSKKVGAISDPFTITNGYAVFSVAAVRDAGVRPFDEVKASLQPVVLRAKKIARTRAIAEELRAKLGAGDSLTAVTRLSPEVAVQVAGPFGPAGVVPGVGRDPFFLGAAAGLSVGQISHAFEGQRGAFLVQVLARTPFDSTAFASQKEMLRGRMLQEKRSRFVSDWLERLKANADIQDHRDQFFR